MSWSDNKLISLNSKFATKLNGSSLSNAEKQIRLMEMFDNTTRKRKVKK